MFSIGKEDGMDTSRRCGNMLAQISTEFEVTIPLERRSCSDIVGDLLAAVELSTRACSVPNASERCSRWIRML